jgi:hypothetical protein
MRRTLGITILIAGLVVVSTAVAQNAPRESTNVSAEERVAKLAERERL